MKAAIFEEKGKVVFKDIPKPKITPNELLVEPKVHGICNATDPHLLYGEYPAEIAYPLPVDFPLLAGHEGSGVIAEVGDAVTEFKVGDRVPYRGLWGTFAEYVKAKSNNLVHLPENLTFEEGATLESVCAAFSCIHRAQMEIGDTVVIFGQGPMGLLILQMARLGGASLIATSEPIKMRREMSKKFGADVVIDPVAEDVVGRIMELTHNRGVDLAIEAAGKEETLQQCVDVVTLGGTISAFGVPTFKPRINISRIHMKCARIQTAYEGTRIYMDSTQHYNKFVLQRAADLVASGKIDVKSMITHVYPFDALGEALEQVRNKPEETLKVILKP